MKLAAVTRIDTPDAGVVAALEGALADAKAGRVTAVAIVVDLTDREAGSVFAIGRDGSMLVLLGELELLKARICDEIRNRNAGRI